MLKPSFLRILSAEAVANTYQICPLSLGTLLSVSAVHFYLGCSWLYPLLHHSWLLVMKKMLGYFILFYFSFDFFSYLMKLSGYMQKPWYERLYIIILSLLYVITHDSITFLFHFPQYSMSPNISQFLSTSIPGSGLVLKNEKQYS